MHALSPDELVRYSRHLRLQEVGLDGQQRLKSARILVVGAGGLGSPAALYLAAAGVGTLGIVDFDRVEAHNLQRQLLHTDAGVGTSKVTSAAQRLRLTNPFITVVEHDEPVTAENALELFSAYDVIVDGTDTFRTRYLNNDAACLSQKPLIYGSVYKFEGSVAVFSPNTGGPCYRCLFPEPPSAGSVPNCAEAGVIGALCGVIGSLQALEAVKWVTGVGTPLQGRLTIFDGLQSTFRTLTVPRDPACPICGKSPSIRSLDARNYDLACESPSPLSAQKPMKPDPLQAPLEISVNEAHRLLRDQPDDITLVDVREPFETAICQVPGSILIPMQQIPGQIAALPRDRHLLVLCHHGGRSLRVTEYLRQQGLTNASNVTGGIDQWAAQVDPSLRRY